MLKISLIVSQNRGIGRAICELILKPHNHSNLRLIATSRKGENLGLGSNVVYSELDISKRESIEALTHQESKHGNVDVLINNAGVNLDAKYGPQSAKTTLDVNYRGTLSVGILRSQLLPTALLTCEPDVPKLHSDSLT